MSALPIVPPATVLILLGIATALAVLPLLAGLVKPNRFYGIRVAAAFVSEQNWYAINSFGAKRFLYFAAIIGSTGLVLDRYPQAPFWVPILCLLAVLPLILLTVHSIDRYAKSL
jgi:hypothetical protein